MRLSPCEYRYKANDFNADVYLNVTCSDNVGEGNKEVIRGLEIRRYETKGVELGAKGRNAMQVHSPHPPLPRPPAAFLPHADPSAPPPPHIFSPFHFPGHVVHPVKAPALPFCHLLREPGASEQP